jgi:hypothetical protein
MREPRKFELVGLERWNYLAPSRFVRVMPPEMPGVVSDWDLYASYWFLDTSTYVSAPSSLKFVNPNNLQGNGATCKYSTVLNIPEGRIVTYVRSAASNPIQFMLGFRIDVAPGSSGFVYGAEPPNGCYWSNGYTLQYQFATGTYYLKRGSTTVKSGTASALAFNTWHLLRLTFWSDPGGAGLVVRFERWDGSNWVKLFNDLNDPTNQIGSNYNRPGIGAYTNYAYGVWFDDTELYKIVWS